MVQLIVTVGLYQQLQPRARQPTIWDRIINKQAENLIRTRLKRYESNPHRPDTCMCWAPKLASDRRVRVNTNSHRPDMCWAPKLASDLRVRVRLRIRVNPNPPGSDMCWTPKLASDRQRSWMFLTCVDNFSKSSLKLQLILKTRIGGKYMYISSWHHH